ncbi:subtilisin-like protein [Lindgomyces ingoldianus]|uniref:Subtilisin-like protein n=1 Tax=Lindgomyces ingoldianus TaxID=673940 RepID=A0ACB6QL09_9PLEO|nr:subtilisin-like protein [Lindgomyces ingoldianus]KAF2467699.1 subtilisin-like protein [Lindgomyces ingoldianus]
MRYLAALLALSSLISAVLAEAPIVNTDATDGVIKDRYIVVYKDDADLKDRNKHEEDVNNRSKGKGKQGIEQVFNITGFNGYAVEIATEDLPLITKDTRVRYLEKATTVKIVLPSLPTPGSIDTSKFRNSRISKRALTSAFGYNWGDVRISHRTKAAFAASTSYVYDTTAGSGTWIYVVDTGINIGHQEFTNRASWGANFIAGSPNTDQNGHGTHVAGTAAGTFVGVAKLANLVAVKVLDSTGSGPTSGVISGLQWAANNAIANRRTTKSVINMSVGGPLSTAMNQMVAAATTAGLTVVVAAGNSAVNANTQSPASAPSAITVAASDSTDKFATFSNFGTIVDIIAPGVSIFSSYNTCATCYATLSGTSMATPHVSGLVAYFMAKDGVTGPSQSLSKLLQWASTGLITSVPAGTPNKLAYNGDGL